MRVLFATTANDGHWGPVQPFARACAAAGHEVRVAAPASYAPALQRAGFTHEPFADPPPELIGSVMDRLPSLPFQEADDLVVSEVFGRIDAQAGLPAVTEVVERWRPDVVLRESAELASLVAAERAGIPHVHICLGMHEVVPKFAELIAEPLEELGRLGGLAAGQATRALDAELVFSSVPRLLDDAAGNPPAEDRFLRFHESRVVVSDQSLPVAVDAERPLVYVTFGSVAGSLPFATAFREALDAMADLDVRVLMTVGRRLDPDELRPWPANAHVEQWWPQDAILAHAAAMVGHGGFGTTMGALAAGVPQVVAPLFSFDQLVNAEHVAAVGAGIAVEMGAVTRAAGEVPRLLGDPSYVARARAVATEIAALPHPSDAVPVLEGLVG